MSSSFSDKALPVTVDAMNVSVPSVARISLHDLYHETLSSFGDAVRGGGCRVCFKAKESIKFKHQLATLYMWAQGLDLNHIQNKVDPRTGLANIILRTLLKLSRMVNRAPFVEAFSSSQQSQRELPNTANGAADDNDTDDSSSESEDEEASDLHGAHAGAMSRIQVLIDGLMDLLPTLRHITDARQMAIIEAPGDGTSIHGLSTPGARTYIRHIQDKFSNIDPRLAARLGEANWQRFSQLQDMQELINAEIELAGSELAVSRFVPMSKFQDSGLGSSLGAKSQYASSVVSNGSFKSTQTSIDRGAARVPPTPEEVKQKKPFPCTICGKTLSHIKSRSDWKIHVFSDLQPYLCTFNDCSQSRTTFPSRRLWADHEIREHRSVHVLRCAMCQHQLSNAEDFFEHRRVRHQMATPEEDGQPSALLDTAKQLVLRDISEEVCLICGSKGMSSLRVFVSHVGRHMEEIALLALPKSGDDTEDESDEEPSVYPILLPRPPTPPGRHPSARSTRNDWSRRSSDTDLRLKYCCPLIPMNHCTHSIFKKWGNLKNHVEQKHRWYVEKNPHWQDKLRRAEEEEPNEVAQRLATAGVPDSELVPTEYQIDQQASVETNMETHTKKRQQTSSDTSQTAIQPTQTSPPTGILVNESSSDLSQPKSHLKSRSRSQQMPPQYVTIGGASIPLPSLEPDVAETLKAVESAFATPSVEN